MYFLKYYILMFLMLLIVLISLSISSFFMVWLMLEVSGLLFVLMIMMYDKFFDNLNMNCVIYFLIQVLSSLLLLISLFYIEYLSISMNWYGYIMINIILISLNMKLGIFPFHFWIPLVMKNLSWFNNFFFMIIMKIIPLILLSMLNFMFEVEYLMIMLSSMISSFMSLNQCSLKLIMAYSSINHTSWMIMSLMINVDLMLVYFMIYMFITLLLVLFLNFYNLEYIFDLMYLFYYSLKEYMYYYMFMIFGLGGLPVFLGFIMKWLVIQELSLNCLIYYILLMILFSLIIMYVYIRMGVYLIFWGNCVIKNILIMNLNLSGKFMIFMILSLFLSYVIMYM